jgi:hypothetical protein
VSSIIEAELAFLQEQRKTLLPNSIVLAQYSSDLVPEILDAIDGIVTMLKLNRMTAPSKTSCSICTNWSATNWRSLR